MDLKNDYIFFFNMECIFTDIIYFEYYENEKIYEYLKFDFGLNNIEQHCKLYLYYLFYKNDGNHYIEFNMRIKDFYDKKHRLIHVKEVKKIKDNSYYEYEDYEPAFRYIDWCLENNLPPIEADTEELYNINKRI